MSKWQLTLIQNGKKLRKYGGTKGDVQYTTQTMIHWLQQGLYKALPYGLIKELPCQFVISRYNNLRTKKKIIMEIRNFD